MCKFVSLLAILWRKLVNYIHKYIFFLVVLPLKNLCNIWLFFLDPLLSKLSLTPKFPPCFYPLQLRVFILYSCDGLMMIMLNHKMFWKMKFSVLLWLGLCWVPSGKQEKKYVEKIIIGNESVKKYQWTLCPLIFVLRRKEESDSSYVF